jgi:hypothetical protein
MLPLSRITFPHFQYSSPSDTSHPPPQVKDLQASPLIPACKKLWQGTINTGKRRSQQHKREGRSSGLGPTGHEDAEFNSNPPIPRIKVYLYMILLFTASRSLKYHLSGNKTPCPIPHIGTIYIEGERGEKNSNKTKEIKKGLLLQWTRKNQSLTRRITSFYRQNPPIPWLRFKIQPLE